MRVIRRIVMSIELLSPNQSVIARRLDIVRDLQASRRRRCRYRRRGRAARLRDRCSHGLSLHAARGRAAVDDRNRLENPEVLQSERDQGHAPAAPVRRCVGGRLPSEDAIVLRRLQNEQGSRNRSREPLRARRSPASPISPSPTRSPATAFSTHPIRRAKSPARSRAISP